MKFYNKFRIWLLKLAIKNMVEKFVYTEEAIELHLRTGEILFTNIDKIKSDIEELIANNRGKE